MKRFNIGYLYIVLCASIFSFVEVALKATSGMFHPMQITVLRFLIGGAVLLPVALGVMRRRGERFTRADAGFFTLLGFLFVCVAMTFYQLAVGYAPAAVVAVLFSCNPIFITLLAGVILREPIRGNHVLSPKRYAVLSPLHTN